MKRKFLLLLPLLLVALSCCEENTSEIKNENHSSQNNGGNNENNNNQNPPTPTKYDWKYSIDFSKCDYEDKSTIKTGSVYFNDEISFNFVNVGSGAKKTSYYEPSVRFYSGNVFSITSTENDLKQVNFTFESGEGNNEISVNVGSLNSSTWQGLSKEIVFSIGGASGHRRISKVEVVYESDTKQPEEEIIPEPTATNLGNKTISEVKEYIASNPITVNSHQCGVNNKILVTIKGFALGKIDLIKSTKSFGLDISYPSKIIIADSTGSIGVATNQGQGTLWNKVNDYQCKDSSRYEITGLISMYLNQPELVVTSFTYNSSLDVTWSAANISTGNFTIPEFYTKAENVYYNCAGSGYGDIITISDLTCYYVEADGSGKRYYNFTDGTNNIRVNAYNLSSCSEGYAYNIIGIISLKNLSPIIIAFKIEQSTSEPVTLDYENKATSIDVSSLRNIHGSQEDTDTRYPDVINSYSKFYKTTGYLVVVEESGKYYIGLSDTYYNNVITGKNNAKANKGIALIKNNNFWNTTEEKLYLFNSYYQDYIFENTLVTVYYVNRQLGYQENKAMWEILLIPQSIPEMMK